MALASAKARRVQGQQLVTEVALLFDELQRRMQQKRARLEVVPHDHVDRRSVA
jgi:hypothetical protein